ncbi:MAG: CCA tRNA nucleotidyltransferase [Desulfobacter sp.]
MIPDSSVLERSPAWPRAVQVLDTLRAGGYKGLVVGGAVRDMLLGISPHDVDILTNAGPDDIARLFAGTRIRHVGQTFEISLVNGVEVASCRGNGTFPGADLGMRDFTINSMAWDSFSHTLFDPHNGQQDLSNRMIRFTLDPGERIEEDPVRMIRACRFAARYDSRIDPDALTAIRASKQDLHTRAAGERVRTELLKAMAMKTPSVFFNLLHAADLLDQVLPSLDRCHGLDGGPFHGETVFEHCLLVGDALPARLPLLRLAGYLHDVGKFDAARMKEGKLTFAGHETHRDALAKDLERLRFSNRETAYIFSLVRAHMRPLNQDSTPRAVRRLLAFLDSLGLSYRDFFRLRMADKGGNLAKFPYTISEARLRLQKILDQVTAGAAFTPNDLAISGRDIQTLLDIGPGPRVGEVKAFLFEKVLDDPDLNTRAALETLVREMNP